jgi:hypothetical protein
MVSEQICLDIIRTLYKNVLVSTVTNLPGTEQETRRESTTENAMDDSNLYRTLLSTYPLQEIDSAVRWLELGGYLGKTYPAGVIREWFFYHLTDKAVVVANEGRFSDDEHRWLRSRRGGRFLLCRQAWGLDFFRLEPR